MEIIGVSSSGPAATTLVIQDSVHAHSANGLILTQVHNLSTANVSHAHTTGNVILTQVHQLVIQNTGHSHTAESPLIIPGPGFEQEGFRWRNDDGDETSATWAGAQDANISVTVETPIRLRVLINGSGNPDPAQFRLEYREVGTEPWEVV
jgi:hypothetical protein